METGGSTLPIRASVAATCLLGFACASSTSAPVDAGRADAEPAPSPTSCVGEPLRHYLVTFLDFGREGPPGVAPGLDQDGIVSTAEDPAGCFQSDYESPTGEPGVDNQTATLVNTLESALGTSVAEVFADAIATGDLLVLVTMEGLDAGAEDPCVNFYVGLGQTASGEPPAVDGEGRIVPGQPIEYRADSLAADGLPAERALGGTVHDGALDAAEVDVLVEVPFDDTRSIRLPLRQATVRAEVSSDGTARGFLAGRFLIEELWAAATTPDFMGDTVPVGPSVLESVADLAPDASGLCQDISGVLVFEAVEVSAE